MNFNFKQALEEIRFLQTPEGKAEEFLRLTINTIKPSIDVNCIEKLCFEIYGEGNEKHPFCYKLYAYYYYSNGNTPRSSKICCSKPFYDRDEVLLVYDTIKNKLKEEGFEPQETPFPFGKTEYYYLIKGFWFEL